MNHQPSALSYRDAGVDIDAGNNLVDRIKPLVRKTFRPEVLTGLGGFGGLYELPMDRYRRPVLVSGTDGVGTKLKLAQRMGRHDTIGIDLVAMCVNDILVTGAEPLFFLDYYATGRLEVGTAEVVLSGIAAGCERAGCALIGGETAEMPGMYSADDYDLAGFSVGIVEKEDMLSPEQVRPGDALIALGSSGPHSNGYSLIRKVLDVSGADLEQDLDGQALGHALLAPTRIYVKSLLPLIGEVEVHAMAHITGGGLTENLPRVLPDNTRALVHSDSWQRPAVFRWLQKHGGIVEAEMLRTFNCGVGMVLVLPEKEADLALEMLTAAGEQAWRLGQVETGMGAAETVYTQ